MEKVLNCSVNRFLLTKAELRKVVETMPDRFTADQLMDRLIFIRKVEQGLEDSRKGRTYSTTEARRKLKRWLK